VRAVLAGLLLDQLAERLTRPALRRALRGFVAAAKASKDRKLLGSPK
jgi:hypothetical protein